ncbi:hypothetical protein LINPERHAP2_LOCUS9104 [Linum perenne]
MDRQTYEPTIIRSTSLALLQQRFQQLERAREMRQQRQFFRFFADAQDQVKPPTSLYEPSTFFHSELVFSSKQPLNKTLQDSSSSFYLHHPTMQQGRYADLQLRDIIPDMPNLHSTNVLIHNTQFSHFDESD